jgi:chemotaxis protein CheD
MRHYHDRDFNQPAIKLFPGEYYTCREDVLIVTVLGSCIAVCLMDERSQVYGMNHFLLPNSQRTDSTQTVASYGINAMELMINSMMKLGAVRKEFKAKVFGGANVSVHIQQSRIGSLNSVFILDYLKAEGIPVIAKDILGENARRVCFFTGTGKVNVKKIPIDSTLSIISEEKSLSSTLTLDSKAGSVDLF